jgi:hypothetical protein
VRVLVLLMYSYCGFSGLCYGNYQCTILDDDDGGVGWTEMPTLSALS